ncbi:hypothetical protein KY289_000759 [Solanum tuberosum]|nr:hypothetical protein KY289_000759 [Solanum tuberosum]
MPPAQSFTFNFTPSSTNFLNLDSYNCETYSDESDFNETDSDETHYDETNSDEIDSDETDFDKIDSDESDYDETNSDETDCDETGSDETDSDNAHFDEADSELLQALRSQVTSMHSQPSPVELGRFSGYNAVGWVLQAELYFDFYAISNAHKLHYVSSYFDGDALEWFHWMSRNNQLVDWKYFKEQVVLRFQNSTVTTPMGILVDTFQAHFDYARYASMVPPVTQVFSFADLNIIPTYCKFESTSKVGKSNAEQVFDEMPLAENSPFSSDNEVVMSLERFAATTEAHLLNECSQQSNHKVFVDEQFDVTTFSSEGHSDLEDEVSEEVCHIQAQFEGSMSVVQQSSCEQPRNRSYQQLFDNLSQTCDCSKEFAENPKGNAIGMRCQFDLVRSTTWNPIIASYFIPSMFEGVTLRLDSSLQWCLSFNAFHAIPAMTFGENQYAAIAYESLVFTLEFEEAFNLTFSTLRGYDLSTLAYHCIPKSKAMTRISHTSDAHTNTFTKIFVVVYSRIHVEIDRNFAMCVSHKTPEFFKLNRNGQISLLDTLDNHVESHNTLTYLAKNVSHYMHSNGSNICDILIDLNLENSGDTTMNHMCSFLNGLKFPDHLMVQVRGSDLVSMIMLILMQKWSMNSRPTVMLSVAASARISRHLSNTSSELPKHSNKITSLPIP